MHLIADFLTLPFFIKNKMWDMVVMLSFLVTIGISKLFAQHNFYTNKNTLQEINKIVNDHEILNRG